MTISQGPKNKPRSHRKNFPTSQDLAERLVRAILRKTQVTRVVIWQRVENSYADGPVTSEPNWWSVFRQDLNLWRSAMGKTSESPRSTGSFFGWVVILVYCLASYEYGFFQGKYAAMSQLYYDERKPAAKSDRAEPLKKNSPSRLNYFGAKDPPPGP